MLTNREESQGTKSGEATGVYGHDLFQFNIKF